VYGGGRLLYPQPEDARCRSDSPNRELCLMFKLSNIQPLGIFWTQKHDIIDNLRLYPERMPEAVWRGVWNRCRVSIIPDAFITN
jgi:hypothetical protein